MDTILNKFLIAYTRGHILTLIGKASREDFWYFAFGHFLLNVVVTALVVVLFALEFYNVGLVLLGIYFLFFLISLIPAVTVSVRRYHDTGHSGWLFGGLVFGMLLPFFVAVYLTYTQASLIAMGYMYGSMPETVSFLNIGICLVVATICAVVNLVILAFPPKVES